MTDWASLRHAYGSAEDIPALLAAAEQSGDDFGARWNDLWSCLCHQGTVYTASFAALPLLAEMSARRAPTGHDPALHLAAAIVASDDGPSEAVALKESHSSTLTRMRDSAERNLAHARNDTEFIYGLQALMAFEDGGVWQRNLDHLADGELRFDCPHCGAYLLEDLAGPDFNLLDADGSRPPAPVQPAEPPEGTASGRILALARAHGRTQVAARLPYMFGRASCPNCLESIDIPAALD